MSNTATATPPPAGGGRTILGHPLGLYVLFFTEMWERFSYYGMRGLLKLYMVNYLFVASRQVLQGGSELAPGDPNAVIGWSFIQGLLPADVQGQASVLYGWYTGLVYLTPVLGGYIADRYLGQRLSVYIGGILMAVGQFILMAENWFFLGLLLLIIGNGAFKPNISTQVGNLYPQGDARRDGAFTIFYMGINLGAFICNFVCGTLAAVYGWRYGFGIAGVGMLLGLVVYALGQRHLAQEPTTARAAAAASEKPAEKQPLTNDEWKRVWALVGLCALNIIFWAVYEQQGNTMQTWADEQTVWPTIFGWQIPSTWFQSFNPFFIFTLAPLLDWVWSRQARRGSEPSSVTKMAIGCGIVGMSFIVMVVGAQMVGSGKGSLFWPVFCTLLLTIGELYLSPIGLSLVTKVAPVRIVSLMMGMWFLSSFAGNLLSGYIGALYSVISKESFFLLLTGLGLAAGAAIWVMNKPLQRSMGAGAGPAKPVEPIVSTGPA
jgi:POT family proton-dependent oligopeptide transporter